MEVNRLDRDELAYELIIRGIDASDETTVADMRKSLRHLNKLEKSGTPLAYPKYPLKFDKDSTEVAKKISEVETLLKDFNDSSESTVFMKISTKLWHAYGRAQRSTPEGDDNIKKKSQMVVKILSLYSSLRHRARKYKRLSTMIHDPLEMADLLSSTGLEEKENEDSDSSTSEDSSDELSDEPVASQHCLTAQLNRPKYVPVY